jgi:hypothetical protein
MTLEELFPHARPWVEHLVDVWPAYIVKPQFAWWEVLHILSLIVLGGSSILVNLRLIGTGLTDEPPSEIARNMRPWLHVGVIGITVTGILIGMANAERLYDSPAFIVKLLCLVGGTVLTYGASLPTAARDGAIPVFAKAFTAVGVALWLLGIYVFITAMGNAPGMWHVLTAAGLILLVATRGRLRWIYLGVLAVVLVVQFCLTHIGVRPDDIARLDPINKTVAWILGGWFAVIAAAQIFTTPREPAGPLAKFIGYATILIWVTAAAAGRWIAFA